MKILLLTNGIFPDKIGGMQKHSYYLAKYLTKMGTDVVLYIPFEKGNDTSLSHKVFTGNGEMKYRLIPFTGFHEFSGHYLYDVYKISKNMYRELVTEKNVDFIYAQGFMGWKTVMESGPNQSLPPIGINFHGLEMFQKPATLKSRLESLYFRPFVQYNLKKAPYVLSLGGNITRLLEKLGKKTDNIIESANGIDRSYLSSARESVSNTVRKMTFIGRFERRKGIQELTSVLQEILLHYKFSFSFIGDIPDALKINHTNVHYHGVIKDESKIKNLLLESDILVAPSYSEGMPTAILEAMACKNAIIASNVGAVDSLVSNDNGWLIEPGNKTQLRESVVHSIKIAADNLERKKQVSRDRVQNYYTWEHVAEATLNNIIRAIEK